MGHPERPARLDAVLSGSRRKPVSTSALVPIEPRPASRAPARAGASRPPTSTPSSGSRDPAAAASTPTPPPRGLVGGGPAWPPAPGWTPSSASTGRGRRRVLRRAPAGPPRHADAGHGLLPRQQRGRHRRRAGRPGRAGADRRLRRPPRQRHPGHLLRRRPACSTCRFHEYPLYPGTGRSRRDRAPGAGAGTTVNFPFPAGTTGDVYRRRSTRWSARSSSAFDPTWLLVSAGLRRPPPRPAHRPRPHGRRLRRPHRASSCRARARRAAASSSSKAATTSRRWPTPRRAALAALAGVQHRPEAPTRGGPGATWSTAARTHGRRIGLRAVATEPPTPAAPDGAVTRRYRRRR